MDGQEKDKLPWDVRLGKRMVRAIDEGRGIRLSIEDLQNVFRNSIFAEVMHDYCDDHGFCQSCQVRKTLKGSYQCRPCADFDKAHPKESWERK